MPLRDSITRDTGFRRRLHYKHYRYRPTIGATTKYHHVVYYPSRPKYCCYYNPYEEVLGPLRRWGGRYSMLAAADQAEKLADIPRRPSQARPMPGIPESRTASKCCPSDEDARRRPPDETAHKQGKIKELNPRLRRGPAPRDVLRLVSEGEYVSGTLLLPASPDRDHVHRASMRVPPDAASTSTTTTRPRRSTGADTTCRPRATLSWRRRIARRS